MKNGLYTEDGELIYYYNGQPEHAGVIQDNGAIYYISSGGRAVKGEHIVHGEMANGILKRGTYTFGEDYKLVKGSYVPPKKSKKKPQKKKKPSKKNVWTATCISVLFLLCIVLVVSLPTIFESDFMQGDLLIQSTEPAGSGAVLVELPDFSSDVVLCVDSAKAIYDGSDSESIVAADPYRAMSFDYRLENCSGILTLSTSPELTNAATYVLQEGNHNLPIDNLRTGTTYYYQVLADGKEYPGSFHTAAAPRFVSIPGVVNTRDIGGYVNLDGKTVKQGMLIRGSELDGLVMPNYFLSSENVASVQHTFGFVHDMDLRSPSVFTGTYQSKLGENVTHQFYEAPQYGQIFTEYYHKSLRDIFRDLANPSKYPMYLHCTHGADRSGTVVFLLQGVLNMSEADMVREYQRTGYVYEDYGTSDKMDVIIDGLSGFDGDTLQEKICSFLVTEVGVTEAELDSIRSIYLQ